MLVCESLVCFGSGDKQSSTLRPSHTDITRHNISKEDMCCTFPAVSHGLIVRGENSGL